MNRDISLWKMSSMNDRGNYEEKAARFELSRSHLMFKKDNKMSSRYHKKQFFKRHNIK